MISKADEFPAHLSEKEVIYSRYDPNVQGYIYYSSSALVPNVVLEPSPISSRIEMLPSVGEDDSETRLDSQVKLEDEKYQMFLKWLEEQKSENKEKEEIETTEAPVECIPCSPIESDEFHDVFDDDDEPSLEEPTVKLNPEYLLLLEKAEKLAANLPEVDENPAQVEEPCPEQNPEPVVIEVEKKLVEPEEFIESEKIEPDIPKEIRVGQTLIQLESPSPEHSDEEVVIQSKLTISSSHLELQTMKTGSSGSQTSLNLLVPKIEASQESNQLQSHLGSQTSLTLSEKDKKPLLHTKGKAPPIPPVPPKTQEKKMSPKVKKPKLLASLTGMFKSDAQSTSKDAGSTYDAPRETQI